jgi:hypothetical protein
LNGVGESLEVWADHVRALFGFIEGEVVEEICVVGKQPAEPFFMEWRAASSCLCLIERALFCWVCF